MVSAVPVVPNVLFVPVLTFFLSQYSAQKIENIVEEALKKHSHMEVISLKAS